MKTIKKYWALFIGAILGIFAIIVAVIKKQDNKQLDKLDQNIDNNNQQIDIITGKTEIIEDQREDVKQDIKEQEAKIEQTVEAKESIQPETPKTVSAAKQNILNKTSKKPRGRKKNS